MAYVRSKTDFVPEVGLVLGSGLGPLADEVEKVAEIPYGEIPHFSDSGTARRIRKISSAGSAPLTMRKRQAEFLRK